jgi:hypothetical protein
MDADTLAYLRFNATHYLCFGVIGCAGFVFLLLFSVNTRLREYFWLGSSLAIVALLRVDEISRIVNIGLPLWLSNAIYFLGNTFTALILIEFVFSFLQRPVPRLFRLIQLLGLLEWYVVAGLPLPSFLDTFMRYSTPGAILLASLTELLMLPMCFRSKLPEMRWIGASVLFIVTERVGHSQHSAGCDLAGAGHRCARYRLPAVCPRHAGGHDISPAAHSGPQPGDRAGDGRCSKRAADSHS